MTNNQVAQCRNWLSQINDEGYDELNLWEEEFIENISEKLDEGMDLSEKQIETLEKIYDKLFN